MPDMVPEDVVGWVCKACQEGDCNRCVDIVLIAIGRKTICKCTTEGHSGEPRDKQILDPETGTVHAPGLTVDEDGTITRTGE